MSTRAPFGNKFSFSALEVEGGDDNDSEHTESDGELVELPTPSPPKPVAYVAHFVLIPP